MTPQDLLAAHNIHLESTAPGRHYTTCPQCSAKRSREHQGNKCLGVTIDSKGVRWGCNHCSWTGPEKGSGDDRQQRQELPAYVYRDANGVPRFRKVRNRPGRQHRFWLERVNEGSGTGWSKGTKGVDTKIIYRADEVKKAIAEGRCIACVEGEKDADNLWALGIAATCNAHGASELGKRPKWIKAHSEQLRGADIVVCNDNDPPGYEHADATCKLSLGIAKRVRRLDLKPHWTRGEMPKGADVSDWLALGHTREELEALIVNAPDYVPPTDRKEAQGEPVEPSAADAEIARLAKLTPLQYEQERKAAAERLDVRASILDKLVQAERAQLGLDGDDGKQGHTIAFPDPEPWPERVDGAALLDGIAKAIGTHVIMAEHSRNACALWAASTFLTHCTMVLPRLAFMSPVKGCGKTTALDVMSQLVLRPLAAANVSPSAVFRVIEAWHPTLLIDEADSFLPDNEELRGVLNSGHRRGGAVLRTVAVGDDFEVRSFSTYGACAIALIGQLPGTLADRSVPIALARRKRDEPITSFRLDRVEHLIVLARKLARWAKDNEDAIAAVEPEMPPGLHNRAADNWRILLAIAAVAGGKWLAKATAAALAAQALEVEESSRLELLLGDIRDVLGDRTHMPSADLVEALVAIEGRPWAEYGRSGRPLTQHRLARLLKPLAIATEHVDNVRSYQRSRFEEAFERYLSPKGGSERKPVSNADLTGTSGPSSSVSAGDGLTSAKCEKPNNDGKNYGITLSKGGNGQKAHSRPIGDAPGLSRRRIQELADHYQERAYDAAQENEGDTRTAKLDAELRAILHQEVFPEHVEVEFERVMQVVFNV